MAMTLGGPRNEPWAYEKNKCLFSTRSGLQDFVRSLDRKLSIEFACPNVRYKGGLSIRPFGRVRRVQVTSMRQMRPQVVSTECAPCSPTTPP